jgi:hypothetical protein
VHQLRSLVHRKDVTAAPVSIVGYVVDSNIPRAPRCAQHRTGKADPPDCEAEIPSFWIADDRVGRDGPRIRVAGWARNYAVVFDAITAYRRLPAGKTPATPQRDDILNVDVPYPLPAVGMRVKVTGAYNTSETVGADMISDPLAGVLSFQRWQVLEPAPSPAAFSK